MISPEAIYTQQKQTINSIICTTITIIKEKETINWSVGVQWRVAVRTGGGKDREGRKEVVYLGAREVASG